MNAAKPSRKRLASRQSDSLGRVDKGDSQISWELIQGRFGGSYQDPGIDERGGLVLP